MFDMHEKERFLLSHPRLYHQVDLVSVAGCHLRKYLFVQKRKRIIGIEMGMQIREEHFYELDEKRLEQLFEVLIVNLAAFGILRHASV
jgi:hypothetical protein